MSADKLQKSLETSQKEYFSLKMKHATGELKEVHLLKFHRKEIARIKTFLAA